MPRLTVRGGILFWSTFAVSALVACYLFVPMVRATFTVFPAATQSEPTWWFPQRINNAVLLWAVANGILGLLAFWLIYRFYASKNGVKPEMLGIRTNAGEFLKTASPAFDAESPEDE